MVNLACLYSGANLHVHVTCTLHILVEMYMHVHVQCMYTDIIYTYMCILFHSIYCTCTAVASVCTCMLEVTKQVDLYECGL